ncbi:MarR family transcriptional regulator [Streptosporangiaceae bacterium NEAU-GS5]|nr:MarR family transcriptional regulator [Streptosporangiaceae bacterium NEAU-GS5]
MSGIDEVMAMARAVKRARGALIEAVRSGPERVADGFALRAVHAQVFEGLDPGGTRLTALAERAQMSHQAMGAMVDELVDHGYLERVPDPADRRARLIQPTERGRAELTRGAQRLFRLYERWQDELRGIGVDQVVEALETFIRICESETSDEA